MKIILRGLLIAVFIILMTSLTCNAEVIELKSGQRVEGVLKSITGQDVVVNIAGQPLTVSRDKINAIYFGPPPNSSNRTPLKDALRVVKALQSTTVAGISYRDYAPRVTDAKIQLDQLLDDVPDGPAKTLLAEALELYVYASLVWNAGIAKTSSNYAMIASNPLSERCKSLGDEIERFGRSAARGIERGIIISVVGVSPVWTCADEKVAEAERLMSGH